MTNNTQEWEKRLMDEFCVMFERATQKDDTIDWVEKMENFISHLLTQQRSEIIKKVEELKISGQCRNKPKHTNIAQCIMLDCPLNDKNYNQAIDAVLSLLTDSSNIEI